MGMGMSSAEQELPLSSLCVETEMGTTQISDTSTRYLRGGIPTLQT